MKLIFLLTIVNLVVVVFADQQKWRPTMYKEKRSNDEILMKKGEINYLQKEVDYDHDDNDHDSEIDEELEAKENFGNLFEFFVDYEDLLLDYITSEYKKDESYRSRRSTPRQPYTSRLAFKSKSGISTLNRYHDRLIKGKNKSSETRVETDNGRAFAGAEATDHGNGHYSSEAYAGAALNRQHHQVLLSAHGQAKAEFGLGGAIAEADAEAKVWSYQNRNGKLDVGAGYVNGGIGAGPGGAKLKATVGIDLVRFKTKSVDVNIGLNANTGFEAGVDGVGLKIFGFGLNVGRNSGISTPFGSVNFRLWE